MFRVETDFTPIRRYETFDQQHAVLARGHASDSQNDRGGGSHRERHQEAPHDESVLSAQALEHQEAAAEATAAASPSPLGALGAWLVERLENMSS